MDVRQVYMKEDGTLTDIPAKDTEQPPKEKQGNLLLWAEEQKKGETWQQCSIVKA